MATRKQKEDLMAALKFTPREIEITLSGYGGEIVMGRMSEEAYDFWQGREDLSDYVMSWDGEWDQEVPPEARFVTDGAWHDVDDICHENGCEAGDCGYLTIEDVLEAREIIQTTTNPKNLHAQGIRVEHCHVSAEEDLEKDTCVFMGQSIEKGVFFCGRVQINRPFDLALLTIRYINCEGWCLITAVEYDGEEVEGFDAYSTTGKSMEFNLFQVQEGRWDAAEELDKIRMPVLEGEEIWSQEQIDLAAEVDRWQGHALTPWWNASDSPIREGRYQVLIGQWPFPSFAEYTKRHGWRQGKDAVQDLKSWRGLAEPV